jgi:hypothetical protein
MKRPDKRRLLAAIQALWPQSRAIRAMVVADPLRPILRGFLVEDARNADMAYLHAFVQPLYVPFDAISLSIGYRLGGRLVGTSDHERVLELVHVEGIPFLAGAKSPAALTEWAYLLEADSDAARTALAYSLAWTGQQVRADAALRALVSALRADVEARPGIGWIRERLEHTEHLLGLIRSDPLGARRLLESWEQGTARALRLPGVEP